MSAVSVKTCSFRQLFEEVRQVRIPDYQRSYTWGDRQVAALLRDLQTAFTGPQPDPVYYLGSVVFYRNLGANTYEIIDGQQRLTTLFIFQYLLHGALPEKLNLELSTHQSTKNLRAVQQYLAARLGPLQLAAVPDLLDRLTFTRIVIATEDAAFTFFDTQNNRGMPLAVPDFLKAYHLRAIRAATPPLADKLQAAYAQTWEHVATAHGPELLPVLFEKMLWRARNWRGQQPLAFENRDLILHTFQQEAVDWAPGQALGGASLLRWALPDECPPSPTPGRRPPVAALLPYSLRAFSVRQPLFRGSHFFEYARTYAQTFALLFGAGEPSAALAPMRAFWTAVYAADLSAYLREFMQLCLLLYYDGFGSVQLAQAAQCFDYWVGGIRLSRQQVRRESVTRALRDWPHNLLDLIAQAYTPQQLFDAVYGIEDLQAVYAQQADQPDEALGPVQSRYRQRVLHYFGRTRAELTTRALWT
ncbi:MAG TPA: DUF262 domain-containing protein [Hymenobacter sp.]|jgi:hypothetical protein|uniref:DUF262 domain-containing protein n=1 Tax=Hymenobacter sp. TaxID=1898978 RepID=UPI002EDA3C9B